MAGPVKGPLAGIRVLDLATPLGEMAGRLLADFGAEVIKVEPPGGCEARRRPPFNRSATEAKGQSLYWAALGLGKRSVVLDLEGPDDRASLREAVCSADVLVESFPPGTMERWGLGHTALSELNPGLISMSITPFGQHGPKSASPATDLTIEASSGRLSLQGDCDRPPLPIGYPQASFHAGAQAAADIIIALNERAISGLGQHLDLSAQEAMIWTLMDATGYPPNTGGDPLGCGDDRAETGWLRGSQLFPCADGYMLGRVQFGPGVDSRSYTKRQLMEAAATQDVRLAPVNTTRDIVEDEHLSSRGSWQQVGEYRHPGPPARFSRIALSMDRPAPQLGEGQELLSRDRRTDPAPTGGKDRLGEAFAGLRVADFSWVGVGPITAKAFADHGATVVRVESETRLDVLRRLPPFKDDLPGLNRSQWFANVNSSKLGLSLNLATSEGRAVARKLVDWADVVVESFTPGTMARFGLDYETLSATRPELIMLSTCLMGQTGIYASYGGFGGHGAAMAGLHAITGWPDRVPCGPHGPYSDVIAPRFTVAALAAAIFERRASGLGQHVDVSQVEASIRFIEPLILDEVVNGVTAGPVGMDSPTACPHGVYPAAGIERYVAIAVEDEAQWLALCSVAPLGEFRSRRFRSYETRHPVRDRIDTALANWTSGIDARDLEARLTAAGVPASAVQRPSDLYRDPQLQERGFFVTLDHQEMGPTPYDGLATRFSAKPVMLQRAAPILGQDNEFVLRELLGLPPDEIAALAESWALL